jgi:hypothetical protein
MRHGSALIFVTAILVRVAFLVSPLVPERYVLAGAHIEVDAVARSLASTGRYADPYIIPTGPTAHPLPIHTALQALIYRAFGVTPAAAYARSVAGIVACAAALAVLPWFAAGLGLGRRAGLIGGLVAAVIPLYGMDDVLGWLWNESMAAVALMALIVAFVRRWQSDAPVPLAHSVLLGVGAGVAFHLAPALLPVVAGFLLFEAWWRRAGRRVAGLLAVVACATLVCIPWAWRNDQTFHHVFFIRDNFGLELRMGNHDGARADIWAARPGHLHPGNNPDEARLVRDLGETAYMSRVLDDTVAWIRAHPASFARLTASRAWHIWFGPPERPIEAAIVSVITLLALLGLWRTWPALAGPQRAAVLIPLALYPLVYYLVGYVPRYMFPLRGILLALAAAGCLRQARSGFQPARQTYAS